jgi:predicted nucleic acid-binding Zn ribbon protein
MPAKIKLEIEGTAWEVLEAFKAFVGTTVLKLEEPDRGLVEWVGPDTYCAHCGKVLTDKQVKQGNKYCSLKCARVHTGPKSADTRRANALKGSTLKKVKALTGRSCKECGKELTKVQKQFCSRACSNRFHMKLRRGVKVTKWKPSISVVAGQGVLKGSALNA